MRNTPKRKKKAMSSKSWTVYMHISPRGKKYIGITSQKLHRRWHGGYGYKQNTHFFRAIMKYGWNNFEHIILDERLTKEEACALEQHYIKKFDTRNPHKGYNQSIGGDVGSKGYKATKETREKLRKANLGKHHKKETCEKLRELERQRWLDPAYRQNQIEKRLGKPAWNKGKKTPAGTRDKQRAAKIGKYIGAEHWNSKKVINLDNGKIYNSFGEVARDLNIINGSHVVDVCKGRKQTAYGFHWAYLEKEVCHEN